MTHKYTEKERWTIALRSCRKSLGSGVISKLLSNYSILVFTFLECTLINHHCYYTAAAAAVLICVPGGYLATPIVLSGVDFKELRTEVMISALYIIMTTASAVIGAIRIKDHLFTKKMNLMNVNCFEASSIEFMIGVQMVCICLGYFLHGLASAISWGLFAILCPCILFACWMIQRPEFALVHFVLMKRLRAFSFTETKQQGKSTEWDDVLKELLTCIYSASDDIELSWQNEKSIIEVIERAKINFQTFSYRDEVVKLGLQLFPDVNWVETVARYKSDFRGTPNFYWIIAEVIKNEFGVRQRNEYMLLILKGALR